ncbi:Tenascin C [Balamuthia mandrillaris]
MSRQGVLATFLACGLILLVAAAYAQQEPLTQSDLSGSSGPQPFRHNVCHLDNKPESLPRSLNSLSYLDESNSRNGFHLHGEYYTNFTEGAHDMAFNLTQRSVVRLYVAPHRRWDIDAYLYQIVEGEPPKAIVNAGLKFWEEEVIAITLDSGSYTFTFLYFNFFQTESIECETVNLELSIVPETTAQTRVNAYRCPGQEVLPKFPSPMPVGAWNFTSSETFAMKPSSSDKGVRILASTNFTLPSYTSGFWRVEAALGFDFLTGGSVGALLYFNHTQIENLDCLTRYLDPFSKDCVEASGVRYNEKELNWVLTSGNYSIHIFERSDQRNTSLDLSCIPFTFNLNVLAVEHDEDLLTCEAPRLPTNLNNPGFMHRGFLNYHERVFIEEDSHDISFHLDEPSFIRIFLDEYDQDLDVAVHKAGSDTPLMSSTLWFKPEALFSTLAAGDYIIRIYEFPNSYITEEVFCDPTDLHIALAPTSSRKPQHHDCQSKLPTLPNPISEADSGDISLGMDTYYYPFNGKYDTPQKLVELTLEVTEMSTLHVAVGIDFLLGDLSLSLHKKDHPDVALNGRHEGEVVVLSTSELEEGSYILSLQLPTLGNTPEGIESELTTCLPFTFELHLKANSKLVNDPHCWDYDLPFALNTWASINASNELHLQGDFLIPSLDGAFMKSQSMTFTPTVDSDFRLYSEPHQIDIDFLFFEDGVLVDMGLQFNAEEELVWKMKKGFEYELLVRYFEPDQALDGCETFELELSIAPSDEKAPTCSEASTLMPPKTLIPASLPNGRFQTTGLFNFSQGEKPLRYEIPFTISKPVFFRAFIGYDFLVNNLNLLLLSSTGETSATNNNTLELAMGQTRYNHNDLPTMLLPAVDANNNPLRYTLVIYETSELSDPEEATCVQFSLTIAIVEQDKEYDPKRPDQTIEGCHAAPLPSTLDTISHLSPLSDYSTHFNRRVLADVVTRLETMSWTVTENSVMRFYIPPDAHIDVDFQLFRGNSLLASRSGYFGEAMSFLLSSGDYSLQMKYYPALGAQLPHSSTCPTFALEFAIAPSRLLPPTATTSNLCARSLPAENFIDGSKLNSNKTVLITLPRGGDELTKPFEWKSSFVLAEQQVFLADLRFDFLSSGMQLTLIGEVREPGHDVPVRSFYDGKLGHNHAFLSERLRAGNYTLRITDSANVGHTENAPLPYPDPIKCSRIQLRYVLESAESVPDRGCDLSEPLPRNLYEAEGGSVGFGGPQHDDGTIRFFGSHFLVPPTADITTREPISFNVPTEDVFMRIYFHSLISGNDLDFYIMESEDAESSIDFSIDFGEMESRLFRLEPKSSPYVLNIQYFRINHQVECNYYQLGLEIKTVSQVHDELLCPLVLPGLPPDEFRLNGEYVERHGNYMFSQATIDDNYDASTGAFIYTVRLIVEESSVIEVDIGYDFLISDFMLQIRNDEEDFFPIHHSTPTFDDGSSLRVDMHHLLAAELEPGTYFLDIYEYVDRKMDQLGEHHSSYCYRFSLSLIADGRPEAPKVIRVDPPGDDVYDPTKPFALRVHFSHPVVEPANDQQLTQWTGDSATKVLYFRTPSVERPHESDWNEILPTRLEFSDESGLQGRHTVLVATWAANSLTAGTEYELILDLSPEFKADGGVSYEGSQQTGRMYTFLSPDDDCGGHCGENSKCVDGACVCEEGYHGSGVNCIDNIPCTPNFCNEHGFCRDWEGYPTCLCFTGYITVGEKYCSACAAGYEWSKPEGADKAECVPVKTALKESTRCKEPLLPASLNTMAYLGYDGEVRLNGHYFIDLERGSEEIKFQLNQTSVFRVVMDSSWVDADISLVKMSNGKTESIDDGSYSINLEETMYQTLQPTIGDDYYALRFMYYFGGGLQCQTINLDLSIIPAKTLDSESSPDQCRSLAHTTASTFPPLREILIRDGNSFEYNRGFTATNAPLALIDIDYPKPSLQHHKPLSVWVVPLTIDQPPAGLVTRIHTEVTYDFPASHLSIMLTSDVHDRLRIVGKNLYNRNVLDELLPVGNYNLTLQLTRPPYSLECSLYDFSIVVDFVDEDEASACATAAKFPYSLNQPNFLDQRGSLHVQDIFASTSTHMVHFDLNATSSLFKVSITPISAPAAISKLELYQVNKKENRYTRTQVKEDGVLWTQLSAGSYAFRWITDQVYDERACPLASVELGIEPTDNIPTDEDECFALSESLPLLPNPLRESFELTVPEVYHTSKTETVATYPIHIEQSMRLRVNLESNFFITDLRLELEPENVMHSSQIISGVDDFNRKMLDEVLAPGHYRLRIFRQPFNFFTMITPSSRASSFHMPPCARFMFDLHLEPVVDVSGVEDEHVKNNNPAECIKEEIPVTLNSLRFLQSSSSVTYHSDSFAIPEEFIHGDSILATRSITMDPLVDSLFRVYTEPHDVDIDLMLYRIKEDGESKEAIASSSLSWNTEETLVGELKAGKKYVLDLAFFNWYPERISSCPVFNMQFSVEPISMIDRSGCPGQKDHWPPAMPAHIPLHFHYDSSNLLREDLSSLNFSNSDAGAVAPKSELLYFQQKHGDDQGEGSPHMTYTFTISQTVDLYMELGYDFAVGDLALNLTHVETGAIYYGSNRFNRHVLHRAGLLQGSYQLEIYQPVEEAHPLTIGCSYFTFLMSVVPSLGRHADSRHPPFPVTNLNSLPYLHHGGNVHLQREYLMFTPAITSRDVRFSVEEQSILRLSTQLAEGESVGSNGNNDGAVSLSLAKQGEAVPEVLGSDHLAHLLEPHVNYRLTLATDSNLDFNLFVNTELAVEPLAHTAEAFHRLKISPSECAAAQQQNKNEFDVKLSNQTGSFFYSRDVAWQPLGGDVGKPVVTFRLELMEEAVIYAEAGFHFLLNDLEWTLKPIIAPGHRDRETTYGRSFRNLNTVNNIVRRGNYTLELYRTSDDDDLISWITSSSSSRKKKDDNEGCLPYSLTVLVEKASKREGTTRCFDLARVPTDLTTIAGGSFPYGGPITDSGRVHLWAHNFLASHIDGAGDILRINITQRSLLSIFTGTADFAHLEVNIKVLNSRTGALVEPLQSFANSNAGETTSFAIFDLHPDFGEDDFFWPSQDNGQRGTEFEIQFIYTQEFWVETCPVFAMNLIMEPYALSEKSLTCPSLASSLPTSKITVDKENSNVPNAAFPYHYSVFDSHVTQQQMDQFTSTPKPNDSTKKKEPPLFDYPIEITLPSAAEGQDQRMTVIATLSFDPLINNFWMEASLDTSWGKRSTLSHLVMGRQALLDGMVTHQLVLNDIYVNPGAKHMLHIKQRGHILDELSSTKDERCYRFAFSLQVLVDPQGAYVSEVLPLATRDLNPDDEFSVLLSVQRMPKEETIGSGSAVLPPLQAKENGKFVNLTIGQNDIEHIRSAFYLLEKERDSNNKRQDRKEIFPKQVWLRNSRPTYVLLFDHNELKENKVYSLDLKSESLFFESAPLLFTPPSLHKYRSAPFGCGANGMFRTDRCLCDIGYDGDRCQRCAAGYHNISTSSPLQCVRDHSGEGQPCLINSCGCLEEDYQPNVPGKNVCTPLGACVNTTGDGRVHCQCSSLYAGDRCQQCAPGRTDWPRCHESGVCSPPCMNGGFCDVHNRCVCPPNWDGSPSCDRCTPGYSGENCEHFNDKDNGKNGGKGGLSGFIAFVKVLGIVLLCLSVLGVVGWAVWFAYKKRKMVRRSYFPMGLEEYADGMEMEPYQDDEGGGEGNGRREARRSDIPFYTTEEDGNLSDDLLSDEEEEGAGKKNVARGGGRTATSTTTVSTAARRKEDEDEDDDLLLSL